MTEDQKKVMKTRDILEVLMQVESLNMQVHETKNIDIGGHLKPVARIAAHGHMSLSADFRTFEVMGPCTNMWTINTITHAEYDEVGDILYLVFKDPEMRKY